MMKKILAVLLAALLLSSLSTGAFAVTDTDEENWIAPNSGFVLRIPDAYREAEGFISFSDGGEGLDPGSGIVAAVVTYVSMPADEYLAMKAAQFEAYENDDMDRLMEILDTTNQAEWNLFSIYGINRGRGEKELRAILTEKNVNPEYLGEDEALIAAVTALYHNMAMREIGEKDGLRYYLCSFDVDDYISLMGIAETDSVYLNEYKGLTLMNDNLKDSVSLTGGAVLADAADIGEKLIFETTDLDGNPVSSEEIFSGHKITMINLWATWCDPCKDELPSLAEMAKDFEQQGCRILGICLDAEDEETMAEGRAILKEAGVDYLNIVPFEGRKEILPNKFYPTTYFVDENGILLDEVVTGTQLTQYPQVLAKLLAQQSAAEAEGQTSTQAAAQ